MNVTSIDPIGFVIFALFTLLLISVFSYMIGYHSYSKTVPDA
jgi:hypothetical protein